MRKAKRMGIEAITVSCECGTACVAPGDGSTMITRDDPVVVCLACGTEYSIDPSIFEVNLRIPQHRQRKQQREDPVSAYPPREVTDIERLSWSM